MAESDPNNPKLSFKLSGFEKGIRLVKEVGFPIAIAIFLLYDRLTVMKNFETIMTEVKYLLQDVRMDIKERK